MNRSLSTLAFVLSTTAASVAGAQTNVAPVGTATQSSDFPGGQAWRAIDGNTNGDWASGSVTATGQDAQAWWQVALSEDLAVQQVVLWNRTDCCAGRLSDYNVSLWLDGAEVASQFFAGTSPLSQSFSFAGQVADRVRVQLTGTNYLSLAEVQVFATALPAVPEPQTWALMLGGLGLVAALARRRTSSTRPG